MRRNTPSVCNERSVHPTGDARAATKTPTKPNRVPRWQPLLFAAALVLGALTIGCDETTGTGDGGGTGTGDASVGDGGGTGTGDGGGTGADAGGPPSGIASFDNAGGEIEVDFATGGEEFVIVPFSMSTTSADAIDFNIKITASGAAKRTFNLHVPKRNTAALRMAQRNPALWARWQNRLAVEAWTRKLRVEAAKMPLAKTPPKGGYGNPIAACSTSADCSATEVCVAGDCKATFDVKTEKFSDTKTVSVAVKRKGTVAAILVDTAANVADGDLDKLLDTFEKTIYPRDVALFGNPPLKSGASQLSSDRNNDGLIWIVLTDKVAEKKSAVGFFVATDFTDDAASNKADILYMVPPSSTKPVEKTYGTLAHELQHLLNYATKVYKAKANGGTGALAALWVDEGLGHFAEDACGFGAENTTLLDQELFTSFGDTRMFETDSANDGLAMRGMAMMFLRYLFERKGGVTYGSDGSITDAGGAAWLQSILASDKTGAEAITATYGDYKKAMDGWIAAVVLDGRGVTDYAPYNYNPLVTDPAGAGAQIGLIVRGARKDATGADVTLKGPLETALSGTSVDETIPNSSAKFFVLKGQTGKVKISVTSKESDFRFAVIKVK